MHDVCKPIIHVLFCCFSNVSFVFHFIAFRKDYIEHQGPNPQNYQGPNRKNVQDRRSTEVLVHLYTKAHLEPTDRSNACIECCNYENGWCDCNQCLKK